MAMHHPANIRRSQVTNRVNGAFRYPQYVDRLGTPMTVQDYVSHIKKKLRIGFTLPPNLFDLMRLVPKELEVMQTIQLPNIYPLFGTTLDDTYRWKRMKEGALFFRDILNIVNYAKRQIHGKGNEINKINGQVIETTLYDIHWLEMSKSFYDVRSLCNKIIHSINIQPEGSNNFLRLQCDDGLSYRFSYDSFLKEIGKLMNIQGSLLIETWTAFCLEWLRILERQCIRGNKLKIESPMNQNETNKIIGNELTLLFFPMCDTVNQLLMRATDDNLVIKEYIFTTFWGWSKSKAREVILSAQNRVERYGEFNGHFNIGNPFFSYSLNFDQIKMRKFSFGCYNKFALQDEIKSIEISLTDLRDILVFILKNSAHK